MGTVSVLFGGVLGLLMAVSGLVLFNASFTTAFEIYSSATLASVLFIVTLLLSAERDEMSS
jgi:cytochrome b subunit of formate dehydrogenase